MDQTGIFGASILVTDKILCRAPTYTRIETDIFEALHLWQKLKNLLSCLSFLLILIVEKILRPFYFNFLM